MSDSTSPSCTSHGSPSRHPRLNDSLNPTSLHQHLSEPNRSISDHPPADHDAIHETHSIFSQPAPQLTTSSSSDLLTTNHSHLESPVSQLHQHKQSKQRHFSAGYISSLVSDSTPLVESPNFYQHSSSQFKDIPNPINPIHESTPINPTDHHQLSDSSFAMSTSSPSPSPTASQSQSTDLYSPKPSSASSMLFRPSSIQYPSTSDTRDHPSLSRSILSYPGPSSFNNTNVNRNVPSYTSPTGYDSYHQRRSSSSFANTIGGSVGMTGGIYREGSADVGGYSGSSSSSNAGGSGGCSTGGPTSHCWCGPSTTGEPPGARAAHSADVIGGNKIYVFGGWNGKKAMNDLYVLEVEKMLWREITMNDPPPERNNHTTSVVGHRLLTHGGHDGTKWLDDLHVLDTENLTWTEIVVTGKSPSPRACHTLSRVNDKVYLFGGYDGQKCFNEIDILDLDTFSWIQPKVSGTQPQARNAHSMTVIDTKLYLFGGHSGNKHLTDLHIFDTITLRWLQPDVLGMPPPGLRGHTATLIGDRVFLFGGYDGKGRSNNLYILESIKLKWLHPQDPDGAPVGRQRHSACLVGAKRLFIFGGFDGTKWLNDLHILDVGRLTEDELTDTAVRSLINNMKKLVGDPEFSDVTLVVEGRDIPAHRGILAAQCDYFRSMFSGQMKESREQKIPIHGWCYDPYMAMLEFLYTGRLSECRPIVICDVMGMADQYGLDALKTLCENILKHSVDHENVCSVLKNADKYQAVELKGFCNNYIFKHADEVLRTKAFEELSSTPWLLMDITRLSLISSSRNHHRGFVPTTTQSWNGAGTEGSGGI